MVLRWSAIWGCAWLLAGGGSAVLIWFCSFNPDFAQMMSTPVADVPLLWVTITTIPELVYMITSLFAVIPFAIYLGFKIPVD